MQGPRLLPPKLSFMLRRSCIIVGLSVALFNPHFTKEINNTDCQHHQYVNKQEDS